MEAQLRRLGPNSRVRVLKIQKECRTKIWLAGRGTSCQIYTKSKYASRQHFSITFKDQKYFISDLQSSNGTFLNNEKLTNEQMLSFGNIISVGVPSEMQDSPDCIVFIFESHSKIFSDGELPSLSKNDEICDISEKSEPPVVDMDVDPPSVPLINDSANIEKNSIETAHESTLNDIELIAPSVSISEPKAKIRKLDESETTTALNPEQNENREAKEKNTCLDEDEDIFAYEALTQVDESQIKTEPELMNYSLTEELIEISDSEVDWPPDLKGEASKSPEADEDDDVVILETIVKPKESTDCDLLNGDYKLWDELTEADKKWMGRLLKVKKEEEIFKGDCEAVEVPEGDQQNKTTEDIEMVVDESENKFSKKFARANDLILPCTINLIRLSAAEIQDSSSELEDGTLPRVEVPRKIIKRVVAKKSVSFDLVPQIKYFEVPSRPKLTISEKGKMRFTRIIFNICNWNTHWLEECKKVAPEKDPPDICEERLRKIPKKFPNHSDYMGAFVPAILLSLWNTIKSKWVTSGDSGFRQTVSFDSFEDFHSENLTVFHCTGLAQNVNAHKQLIREGHLVLLRLHQVQNPHLATPAIEKYSKKLGYLVFGFVESKTYERFHGQPLHGSLAERCASIVGDLHIVRLRILVKKRPGFHVDKQKLIQLTVVQQISHEIKMFKGICFLPDSPLCNAVLKPPRKEVQLLENVEPKNLVFKGPVDDAQSSIVRKLSHALCFTDSLLFNIHGAAGTGKGQVIIGLILQCLYGDEWKGKRPKILYCSQWSIPLDEMVVKLKNQRQTLSEPFSLVRVGPIREVKPEVRDLSLSNLASNLRNSDKTRCSNGKNFDAEIEVIKEADVICTTCPSAGISKMCMAFERVLAKNRQRKVICIIDEAMSCKEPDSVIPLLLGVTHLVLVGDVYQLKPTFSGPKTHSLGYDNSLFQRIYKNFVDIPKDLWPIFILKTQYRMNTELSKFTSQLIYNTLLHRPTVSVSNRIGNMKSRLLFVDQTPENLQKEEKESRELRIVSQLIKTITKMAKVSVRNTVRFALITCDAKQTESLQLLLPKREFPEVEVDVIQAFQGREFDAVVLVYDGREIATSCLATALTRARCSLFIFTSERSMSGNAFFLKIANTAEEHGFLKYVHPDMSPRDWEQIVTGF